MKTYKPKHEMNEGDTAAGVVYATAAEQRIRGAFDLLDSEDVWDGDPPTVIGYMVEVDDTEGMDAWEDAWEGVDDDEPEEYNPWTQIDLDRKTELTNKRRLNDVELKELAAINRRLGRDVTR